MSINNALNVATVPVRDILRALWLGVIALIIAVVVMWVFNIIDMKAVVIPIALIGSFLIAIVGFKASNVVGFGIFGAIIGALKDRDVSQGAAAGVRWLTEILVALGLAWVLAAFTLMTWSFQHAPGAFWVLYFGVALILLVQQHYKIKTSWTPWIVMTYAVICILVSGWTTFGGAYTGKVADVKTGEPLYMMDPITRNIINDIKPADCRPTVEKNGKPYQYRHQNKDGTIFDYAKKGTCWSPESPGVRAVPLIGEDVYKRSPAGWTATTVDRLSEAADAMSLPDWARNWVVWVIALLILIIVLRRQGKKKEEKGFKGEFSIADKIMGIVVVLCIFVPILGVVGIALDWSGVIKSSTKFVESIGGGSDGLRCTTQKDLRYQKFDKAGRPIVICPDEGRLYFFVEKGQKLSFSFSDRFKSEHDQTLANRNINQFVSILSPGEWQNPAPAQISYRLVTTRSIPSVNYVSGWDSSGIDKIELYVKSVDY